MILKITRKTSLLEFIESVDFSNDLADSIEGIYKSREFIERRIFEI